MKQQHIGYLFPLPRPTRPTHWSQCRQHRLYYHLRRLRQLRRQITQDATKQLVCSLILIRIDYCNSNLVGLPVSSIAPLQCLQNAAALVLNK